MTGPTKTAALMKRLFVIPAVIALAFVCSCNKEQEVDNPDIKDDVQTGITEFRATLQATKTQLGAPTGAAGSREWPNLWSDGDVINVNGVESAALSTGDGYVGTDYAVFHMASAVSGPYYAAYPASAVSEYSAGGATITIPAAQSFVEGNYDPAAYIMIGKSDTPTLSFSPMMGLIQLTTTAPAEGTLYIKSISVEPVGDENMSGVFTTTENYAGITGGTTPAITISAASGTTKTFGTVFTFAVPAMNYASGVRFRITANTAADGTGDDKVAVFAKQSAFDVAAGTLYPLTAPAFKMSAVNDPSVVTINSSTLGVSWTGSNPANNKSKAWELSVYSDSGCNTLVRTISIPKNAACWTDDMTTTVNFAVGGLNQNTTYYFKVKDVQNDIISSAVSGTTDAFTVVPMANIGTTTTGTVFAEDFSELCGFGVKYNGLEYGGCYNNTAAKRLDASDWASIRFVQPEDGEWQLYNSGLDAAVSGKRLAGWLGEGNAVAKCGYLKLGGESLRGYALTPAFTVDDGYMARVTVTVNAAKYAAGTIDHSIAVVHTAGSGDAARQSSFTWVDTPDPAQYDGSVNASGTVWEDIVVSNLYIRNGDRIEFGSAKGSGTSNQRILMNSIKVSVDEVVPEADYLISCYERLKAFMDAVGTSAGSGSKSVTGIVTHNITLTSAQQNELASSYPLVEYTGSLKGQNHTITGLQKPFFADLQGDVEYLTLNSIIDATADTFEEGPAIFAEELNGGGSMYHCTSQGSVTFHPTTAVTNATRYVAGLVGYVSNGTVTNCSNAAAVSFPHNSQTNDMIINVGGAIGAINSATSFSNISNSGSVSVGVINATSTMREGRIGGVVGYIPNASSITGFNNSGPIEFTGTVYGKLSIGGVVGYTAKAVSSSQNSGAIIAGGSMSYSSTSGYNNYRYIGGIAGYVSANVALTDNVNTSTGAITNTGSSAGYTLIGGISGYANGVISGGSNAASVEYSGSSGSTVAVGGIVGRTPSSKTGTRINGVTNSGDITVSESSRHDGKYFYVSGVSAHHQSGDVLAHNSGSITVSDIHCKNVFAGALCAQAGTSSSNKSSILANSDNSATGDISISGVTATADCFIGGLVGRGYGSISSAENKGDVEFASSSGVTVVYVGGLSGKQETVDGCSISSSSNSGSILNEVDSEGGDINVGGLAGVSNISISDSYNEGTVTNSGNSYGDMCIGGLVGYSPGITLTNCHNTRNVSNTGNAGDHRIVTVGGLIGWSRGCTYTYTASSNACYNTGSITNSGTGSNDGTGDGSSKDYSEAGVCLGGLLGLAEKSNTLTSTSSKYNYNNGAVKDNSSSANVAVGGVCGYAGNDVSSFNYCRNLSSGTVTISGSHTHLFYGGIVGGLGNSSTLDYANNSGAISANSATMAQAGYLRLGGIIGGWTNAACTSQTITGCVNSGSITIQVDNFGTTGSGDLQDSYVGGIAGGGNNSGVCGKVLKNCKNSGAITMGSTGSTNSGKLYHRFCVGGIVGFTDVNPTGSKCIANIRFRSTSGGNNRIGGIAGEMMIESIHDITYKGTVSTNGTATGSGSPYYANYTGGLVGNVGTGTRTFTNCTVSGTMFGPGSGTPNTTKTAGIFFSCAGGGTGPTVNISSCTVGSGTRLQTGSSDYAVTITSKDQITAANVCGTNGTKRTCTTGSNDGKSTVVDPDTISLD